MASRRDKRRQEIARYLKVWHDLGAPDRDPYEQALWVVLARHGTREGATRALNALARQFVDINEFRASKTTEIAEVIQRNVKNDAYHVARRVRGLMWRFHKDHHSMDFGVVESLTADQLRKYLAGAEDYVPEMAVALFCYFCRREEELARLAEEEEKPKKRPEREASQALERLRVLCATAAYGAVPAKTKMATAHRLLVKAWAYGPLPDPAEVKKPARKKAAKKIVAKKAPTKTANAAQNARGGGTSRPRTTRATRARTPKKSSRR